MNKLALRFAWVLTFLLFVFVSILTVIAQEAKDVIFNPPNDIAYIWARRAGLVVMIFSVLLILFELLMRRHRLMEARGKWVLFLGICLLPLPVMFLSSGVGMEESKAVAFCTSCHEPMGPFLTDMKDPNSETLAAAHYKNQFIQKDHCWTCHSDYGIAGTTKAKLKGLFDILKVTTNNWKAPVKLNEPYNWTICLQCHGKSALFMSPREDASAHDGVLKAVLNSETTCTDCHELAHPPREERSYR